MNCTTLSPLVISLSLALISWMGIVPAYATVIATVPVGNAGNTGDSVVRLDTTSSHGAVGYDYRIGTYEVTNAQYAEFLNAVDSTGVNSLNLYTSNMSSHVHGGIDFNTGATSGSKYVVKPGYGNTPVNLVSWYDSLRFSNWLHNGQGSGSTETGAYTLGVLGAGGVPTAGLSITRNASATWFLPNEEEWYKAAYHKNNGVTADFWTYPTESNSIPFSDQAPGSGAPIPAETANFNRDDSLVNGYNDGFAVTGLTTTSPTTNYLTDVGAYSLSMSAYGTFDQGGNIWEMTESLSVVSGSIAILGGGWGQGETYLASSGVNLGLPDSKNSDTGFRVAFRPVPEPNTLLLSIAFGGMLLRRRFRG